MIEYGIFNDEGCIDRGYYNSLVAKEAADKLIAEGEEVMHHAMCECGDCEGPYGSCENEDEEG